MLDQIKTMCNGLMQLCYVLANRIHVIIFFDFDGQETTRLNLWNVNTKYVNIAVLPAFSKSTVVARAIMHGNEVFVMYGCDAELSIKWRTQPTASEGEGGQHLAGWG